MYVIIMVVKFRYITLSRKQLYQIESNLPLKLSRLLKSSAKTKLDYHPLTKCFSVNCKLPYVEYSFLHYLTIIAVSVFHDINMVS